MKPYVDSAFSSYRGEKREHRQPTRTCEHPGCVITTSISKPYCTDHIEQSPYVKALLESDDMIPHV